MLIDELVMKPEVNQSLLDGQGMPIKWWNKRNYKRKRKKSDRWTCHKNIDGYTPLQQAIINYLIEKGDASGIDIASHIGTDGGNIARVCLPLIRNKVIGKSDIYKSYYYGTTPPKKFNHKPVYVRIKEKAKELKKFTSKDLEGISKCTKTQINKMKEEGLVKSDGCEGQCALWEWIG